MNSEQAHYLTDMFQDLWEERFIDKEKKIQIKAEFYPYTTIKSTIRRRGDLVFVRISDILIDAPFEVIAALGILLFCKLEKKPSPKEEDRVYRDYVNSKKIQEQMRKVRKKRGKKMLLGPEGKFFHLEKSFDRVNDKYFEGELKKPDLTWSQKKTKTRFGHHDNVFNTIVISRTLDNGRFPLYLVDYVMYHEMLHMKHKRSYKNGRHRVHTRAFKEDEMRFKEHKKAKSLLKKISGRSHYLD